jgi:hypothetical protein
MVEQKGIYALKYIYQHDYNHFSSVSSQTQ